MTNSNNDNTINVNKKTRANKYINVSVFLLIALFLIVTAGVAMFISNNKTNKIDSSRIKSAINNNDCTIALRETEGIDPSLEDLDNSILLLEYRSNCYIRNGEKEKALESLTMLKKYYRKQNNFYAVNLAEKQIQETNKMSDQKNKNENVRINEYEDYRGPE